MKVTLPEFERAGVMVVGDVMLDRYWYGPTSRISPEAPVPVVKVNTIEERPDFIVLDPPRDGINPKALRKIINYGVERMVYISCKPTSLARDLEMLQESGYHLVKDCCVDMFPWSANVETVCLLSKKAPV